MINQINLQKNINLLFVDVSINFENTKIGGEYMKKYHIK
jgi:hypothetical protein